MSKKLRTLKKFLNSQKQRQSEKISKIKLGPSAGISKAVAIIEGRDRRPTQTEGESDE